MDNLKYYNDSLAYDFEMFMPSNAARKRDDDNIVKMPRRRVNTKAAAKSISLTAFSIMASVFVLAALCGNIFLRLQINEVNSKINSVKSEISSLDSEKTSLEMKLEQKISFSNIEKQAVEMGMHKMEKQQVKYIRVNDKNTATTKNGTVVSSDNK